VFWFVEKVLPIVLKQVPDLQLFVVGSNVPTVVTALASDHVIIKGYLSDAELGELYDHIKMAIMPLRWGAGLKGKTVEAMVKGIPLVSTTSGLEGMVDIDKLLKANDTEEEFAEAILALYNNNEALQNQSMQIVEYSKKHFTKASASLFFQSLFK
jgi:glycosyltransferase involved in cell wall biosynthesis